MKRCKECECLLPDDYEGDICNCCLDDRAETESEEGD